MRMPVIMLLGLITAAVSAAGVPSEGLAAKAKPKANVVTTTDVTCKAKDAASKPAAPIIAELMTAFFKKNQADVDAGFDNATEITRCEDPLNGCETKIGAYPIDPIFQRHPNLEYVKNSCEVEGQGKDAGVFKVKFKVTYDGQAKPTKVKAIMNLDVGSKKIKKGSFTDQGES